MNVGDIVQLKSGGPNMTVDGFLSEENGKLYENGVGVTLKRKTIDNNNPFVICRWFDNTSSYKTGVFRDVTLEVQK
jgi:uncharacterized protein YodC (DUF2158 family)